MEVLSSIKRIFWHELGHLCVGIVKVDNFKELYISNMTIWYDDDVKWSGYVETLPEAQLTFNKISEENNKFAYSLLDLICGCMFEIISFQIISNDYSKTFEDCFCMRANCIGNEDWKAYQQVLSEYRELHPNTRGNKDLSNFLEVEIIFIFYVELKKMIKFFNDLDEIVNFQAEIILNNFQGSDRSNKYSFKISDELLEELIENVKQLTNKYGFIMLLESITGKIIQKIEAY